MNFPRNKTGHCTGDSLQPARHWSKHGSPLKSAFTVCRMVAMVIITMGNNSSQSFVNFLFYSSLLENTAHVVCGLGHVTYSPVVSYCQA